MKADQDTAETLLTLYNEIDHFLRQEYPTDKYADHGYLIQHLSATNPVVARNQQVLRAVAQIRNSLVHNPIPSVATPITLPNTELIKLYASIHRSLLNPPNALHIAIPAQQIFTSTLAANAVEVMGTMYKNIYTHVPIIENNDMIGIFSENCILAYLVSAGEAIVTKDMTINDFKEFLPLSAHLGECFKFLPKNSSLSEVYNTFSEAIHQKKRVGMVFITEHGKETEKPLGIITAWDLTSPELVF